MQLELPVVYFVYLVLFLNFNGGYGKVTDIARVVGNTGLSVRCVSKSFEEQDIPSGVNFTRLTIRSCPLPNGSFADVLKKRNSSVHQLESISLQSVPTDQLLTKTHLEGLNLTELIVQGADSHSPLNVTSEFLEACISVKDLLFDYVSLPEMPASMEVRQLSLQLGRSEGGWGGCENLNTLIMSQWEVPVSSKDFLAGCNNLEVLQLLRMPSVHALRRILKGVKSLQKLNIADCDIHWLTADFFVDTIKVQKMLLIRNIIRYMDSTVFENLNELSYLDLTGNVLTEEQRTIDALRSAKNLQDLKLDRNALPNFCDYFQGRDETNATSNKSQPLSIKSISLVSTGINKVCFRHWNNLETINLSSNKIIKLDMEELPISRPGSLALNLKNNPVSNVEFEENDYKMLKGNNDTHVTMTLTGLLDCDCKHGWFARAVRESIVVLTSDVLCDDDVRLINHSSRILECDKFTCGESSCICRRSWLDNTTEAECSKRSLTTLPRLPGVKKINVSDNDIDTFYTEDLYDSLLFLDLSNNRIGRADEAAVAALFAVPSRRVALAGNPIVCNCANRHFIDAMKEHKNQVVDYEKLVCVENGKSIDEVDTEELCAEPENFVLETALIAAAGVLLGLGGFLAAIWYRYGQAIKIFLYARGICLCCMAEDELDEEKLYDAFLSFSHDDWTLTTEELLPGLEKTHKVCVHYRDWVVGDMIPTQITRSVETSRRTIIVLSKSYVKSLWGLLEFRTAHVSALSEGRVRVIVVVIDDVTEDDTLDVQLRSYLRTNTYLKWGDPWFWDKLNYAMPHRSEPRVIEGAVNYITTTEEELPNIEFFRLPALPAPGYTS